MNKAILATLFIVLLPSLVFSALKKEIGTAVESKYELTKRSGFSDQVKEPGPILFVSKPGLQANEPSGVLKSTVIKKGKIEKAGGGSIMPGSSGKPLKVGEQVYLYSFSVGKDAVTFLYGTVDSYAFQSGKSTKLKPFQLAVKFEYDVRLEAVETQRILDDMAAYFSTEQEAANSDEGTLKLG